VSEDRNERNMSDNRILKSITPETSRVPLALKLGYP